MKSCRYPMDLQMGMEADIYHLGKVRQGARLLAVEAVLRAENGESELAASAVMTSLGLAHSLAREPLLISQLVLMACHGITVRSLERVLARAGLTDDQLVRIAAAFAEEKNLGAAERTLAGMRCMTGSLFMMEESEREKALAGLYFRAPKAREFGAGNHMRFLDAMESYLKAARLPYPERLEAAKATAVRLEPPPQLFEGWDLSIPAAGRYVVHNGIDIALTRAAMTALAAERYRFAEGKFPGKLADLVPKFLDAVPKDPFDGNPLRYRRREKGYVVYSIGEDGIDGGGEEREAWKDVPFTVER